MVNVRTASEIRGGVKMKRKGRGWEAGRTSGRLGPFAGAGSVRPALGACTGGGTAGKRGLARGASVAQVIRKAGMAGCAIRPAGSRNEIYHARMICGCKRLSTEY